MTNNIWDEDLNNIYTNNENNNTLGGYFPIGEGGTWHSGIHIYNESVMPFLRGNLVAYRLTENFVKVDKKTEVTDIEFQLFNKKEQAYYPEFSDSFIKKITKVREQKPKQQEDISNNFFILKHSFFDGKLVFYSMYNNIIPDNEYYKDFLDFKPIDSSFTNKKLFFYRTWHYKCEIVSSCAEESVIMGKKIFKGAKISSCKLSPEDADYDVFRDKYKSQTVNYLECKTEENSNFDTNFTIQSDLVDIKSFNVKFENSDLILRDEDLLYNSSRTYNKLLTYTSSAEEEYNQEQLDKEDFFLTKTGEEKSGIKQNSDYICTKVLIPSSVLSTNFRKYDNIYSMRTNDETDGQVYRVSDIKDIKINESNCPLYYEDITKDDKLLLENGIVRLSGTKLLKLFSQIEKNKIFTICRNEDINEIISNFEIIESDKSNANELDLSEKDYIFFYKNENWEKQNILFFIDGKYYKPIEISSIVDTEFKALLNELLTKSEKEIFDGLPVINANISILKTEPISVYKDDSYKELLSIYNENESYKKIKDNGHYTFFRLYIQSSNPRTYKVENNIKVTSLSGNIKKTVNTTYPVHGKLLYNNLENNNEPKIFIDSDFDFLSDEFHDETKVTFNTILYGNETYSLINIPSECLQAKIENNEKYKLERDGNIKYPETEIEINSNLILGEPYTEDKYVGDKPFYDIAVFMRKNYLEDTELQNMDKKYYIYSELLKGQTVYKDSECQEYKFFIPEESKIKSVGIYYDGAEKDYSIKFDYIAIYMKDTDLKFSFDTITLNDDFKLNDVAVDSKKVITLDKIGNLQLLSNYFSNKAGGKKLNTDSVDGNYCKVYITNKEVKLPDNMFVFSSNFLKQNKIIIEGNQSLITTSCDYNDFLYYNSDPRKSPYTEIKTNWLFIPAGTVFEVLEYLTDSCRLKILSIPVYINKKGIKNKCIIDKKPSSSIILYGNGRIYTEATKGNDEIAKRFYDNITSIIGDEYDYGSIVQGEGRYNVFIPAEKLKIDKEYFFKDEKLFEKYSKTKKTDNESFVLYEENPLFLHLAPLVLEDSKKIKNIGDGQVKKANDRFGKKYCPVQTEQESFYIPYDEIEKYRENAFNWKKFFVNCEKEEDDDFLCDLKKFSENFDFDKEHKEILNKIFETKTVLNDLQELYKTKTEASDAIKTIFRYCVVTHLHELDLKAYDKMSENPDIKYIKDRCKEEEICNAISSNSEFSFIKNQNGLLTFVHPVYFLNHLKKANIFEFNPYIGHKTPPRINQHLGKDPEYEFITNIGFSPAVTSPTDKTDGKFLEKLKANINGTTYYFATLNCPYGISHSYNVYDSNGKKKAHTGIDLPSWTDGVPNAPIISFINGIVWGIKWESSYGNILLIKDNNSDFLYLLAHLEKIMVGESDLITPGQIVALGGSTGTGGGGTASNVHLHLEVFNVSGYSKDDVISNKTTIWNSNFDRWSARKDPLNNIK